MINVMCRAAVFMFCWQNTETLFNAEEKEFQTYELPLTWYDGLLGALSEPLLSAICCSEILNMYYVCLWGLLVAWLSKRVLVWERAHTDVNK